MPFVSVVNNLFDKEDNKPSEKEAAAKKEGNKDTKKNAK
jgi:hypothetical protein